jgi:phosphomannomutase
MLLIKYDVRGIFNREINPEVVDDLIFDFKKFLERRYGKIDKIILSSDLNEKSLIIKDYLIKKFSFFKNLGSLPTPIFYFFCLKEKLPGIILTASHLPKTYAGLKFFLPDGTSWKPKKVKKIKKISKFEIKKIKKDVGLDYIKNYFEELSKNYSLEKKFEVRFDVKNDFLKFTFPYFKFLNIYHNNKSDFFIKSDNDNDRIFYFYKRKEIFLDVVFYFISLSKKYKKLGVPIYFSKFLENKLKKLNKKIFYIPTGHYFFKKAFRKYKLDLAFEPSGHFYLFKDLKTEGPYLALGLFLHSITDLKDLLKLNSSLQLYRFDADADSRGLEKLVSSLQKKFKLKLKKFDGYFLYNQDFYIHLRKSKTENKIRVSYEGSTKYLKEIKKWLMKI